MNVSKEELAYTAGIIDGEGCIKVYKVDAEVCHRPHNRYTLGVQVNMVDTAVVKWLHQTYGGYFYLHKINVKNHPNWRDSHRWYLQNHHCTDFLTAVLPYLRIKKVQAQEALKFLQVKKGDIESKHKFWETFKILNHVGRT